MANPVLPNLKVVESRPWLRSTLIAGFALTAVLCFFLGLHLGQHELASAVLGSPDESADDALLEQQLAAAQAKLVDMELNVEVQQQASNALREDLTMAHGEVARLREEVTFYKGLMSPSSVANGLQIPEFELSELDAPRQFKFRLLMTQVALRRSYIAGDVRMDVIGRYESESQLESAEQAVLSLTELSEMKAYPMKFRFRYFQDLAGEMTLPEGFMPERILVTANEKGKPPQQVTFNWLAQSGAQSS